MQEFGYIRTSFGEVYTDVSYDEFDKNDTVEIFGTVFVKIKGLSNFMRWIRQDCIVEFELKYQQ